MNNMKLTSEYLESKGWERKAHSFDMQINQKSYALFLTDENWILFIVTSEGGRYMGTGETQEEFDVLWSRVTGVVNKKGFLLSYKYNDKFWYKLVYAENLAAAEEKLFQTDPWVEEDTKIYNDTIE